MKPHKTLNRLLQVILLTGQNDSKGDLKIDIFSKLFSQITVDVKKAFAY